MTGWKRNDELRAPASIAQKCPIDPEERRRQLLAQAAWLESKGEREVAMVLRQDAEGLE